MDKSIQPISVAHSSLPTVEVLQEASQTKNLTRIAYCGRKAGEAYKKGNQWLAEGAIRAAVHLHLFGDDSAILRLFYTEQENGDLVASIPPNVSFDAVKAFFVEAGVITGWKLEEGKIYVSKEAKRHQDLLTSDDPDVIAVREQIFSFSVSDVAAAPKAKDWLKGLKSQLWKNVKLFHDHTAEDNVPTKEQCDQLANYAISAGACTQDEYTQFWNRKSGDAARLLGVQAVPAH